MESNKDDAEKCFALAQHAIQCGDKSKARRLLNKAQRLYPLKKFQDLLDRLDGCGNGSAASNGHHSDSEEPAASGAASPDSNTRHRGSSTTTEPECAPEFTPDQLSLVKQVRKCKDYYEILGVTKDCSEDDLKKSYRKMALKLHPDKNHAPGASEAFKAVGNAFAVLSDADKRERYDKYGSEEEIQQSRRSRHSHDHDYSRGFEADITPEELFNMFFGGGFPSGRVNPRQANQRRQRYAEPQERREQSPYAMIMQLAPILFLVVLSLLSSVFQQEAIYSLHRTERYAFSRRTQNLDVPYFVKDNFGEEFKGNLRRLESQIEEEYISHLRGSCFKERSYKENMLWRARNFNDAHLYEKATNMKTPSCDKLQELYS